MKFNKVVIWMNRKKRVYHRSTVLFARWNPFWLNVPPPLSWLAHVIKIRKRIIIWFPYKGRGVIKHFLHKLRLRGNWYSMISFLLNRIIYSTHPTREISILKLELKLAGTFLLLRLLNVKLCPKVIYYLHLSITQCDEM